MKIHKTISRNPNVAVSRNNRNKKELGRFKVLEKQGFIIRNQKTKVIYSTFAQDAGTLKLWSIKDIARSRDEIQSMVIGSYGHSKYTKYKSKLDGVVVGHLFTCDKGIVSEKECRSHGIGGKWIGLVTISGLVK